MKLYNVTDGPLPANDDGGQLDGRSWGDVDDTRAKRYVDLGLAIEEPKQDTKQTSAKTKAAPKAETTSSGNKSDEQE